MRFIESKQSSTSPLRYILELKPKEAEEVKDLLEQIIKRLMKNEEK
jgi:hypothetical protein|tara:strand:- start:529 stop:666 length:138 start_codon:yes stop_codon:yes gene_type:complete